MDWLYDRVIKEANYIVENGATVRETARVFGLSKSTIYKDVTERLKKYDSVLARKVENVLAINKAERHIRGGNVTKEKYKRKRAGNKNKKGENFINFT